MPSGRSPPGFGIITRRTGWGRYLFASSSSRRPVNQFSARDASVSAKVIPSTPGAPAHRRGAECLGGRRCSMSKRWEPVRTSIWGEMTPLDASISSWLAARKWSRSCWHGGSQARLRAESWCRWSEWPLVTGLRSDLPRDRSHFYSGRDRARDSIRRRREILATFGRRAPRP